MSADEHALERHDVEPNVAPFGGVSGDERIVGDLEVLLVTKALEATPPPPSTEPGLNTTHEK